MYINSDTGCYRATDTEIDLSSSQAETYRGPGYQHRPFRLSVPFLEKGWYLDTNMVTAPCMSVTVVQFVVFVEFLTVGVEAVFDSFVCF